MKINLHYPLLGFKHPTASSKSRLQEFCKAVLPTPESKPLQVCIRASVGKSTPLSHVHRTCTSLMARTFQQNG